jgi:hypothetical protein
MSVQKAMWQADGKTVRLTMPLTKVDQENRIVSGFATLDNIDTGDDVVLAEASAEAFGNFRGNIRLMHQPIPAGKLVNFREDNLYDPETGKLYKGIYVDVYVSKGAPEVWEMCLDGTLTGFSIGGQVVEAESEYVADAGKVIRYIKKYVLIELSLVDSPANQLCDIFSITKSADGTLTASGMATEVVAENVFWCGSDRVAFTSRDEAKDCNVCGNTTENIGWFESDGGDVTEKMRSIVDDFAKTVEGRENTMADEIEVTEETAEVEAPEVVEEEVVEAADAEVTEEEAPAEEVAEEEVVETETAETEEAADEEVTEESAEAAEEEVVETPDFAKMFADLSDTITKALEANADATAEELVKVNDRIAALDTVATKIDELAARQAELEKNIANVSEKVESVEKTYSAVEKSVGIKKSGDLGGSQEETRIEKSKGSIWGGRFFGSVDNI